MAIKKKYKKHMSNIVSNILVLKFFNIQIGKDMVVSFMEVIWYVPSANWLKVNTNNVVKSCLGLASCIGSF